MEPITLTLANGATLTGLANLPPKTVHTPRYRPLIIGLHGGSYSGSYFDVNSTHTASLPSNALSVPFIAINRPNYAGSTSFYPIATNSSDPETYGTWLHRFILPLIWETFGIPHGCNSIILHCHSLGTTGAVIAAATHSQESPEDRKYPIAGIVISGFGTDIIATDSSQVAPEGPEFVNFPPDIKDALMMPNGTCDPSVYEHTTRLNLPCPSREIQDIWTAWLARVRTEWAPFVKVPVMIGVAELDCYWKGTKESVRDFMSIFTGSGRVEGGVIRGAPHNLEMSYWGSGWYARSFGFGLECAASFGVGV